MRAASSTASRGIKALLRTAACELTKNYPTPRQHLSMQSARGARFRAEGDPRLPGSPNPSRELEQCVSAVVVLACSNPCDGKTSKMGNALVSRAPLCLHLPSNAAKNMDTDRTRMSNGATTRHPVEGLHPQGPLPIRLPQGSHRRSVRVLTEKYVGRAGQSKQRLKYITDARWWRNTSASGGHLNK